MQIKTLKGRLLLASVIILPLVLGITSITLDKAFRHSLDAAEEVRLERYFYLLFSLADLETIKTQTDNTKQVLTLPSNLLEPDLEQPTSGVFAWVHDTKNNTVWRSNSSLLISEPPPNTLFSPEQRPGDLQISSQEWNNKSYFFASFDVLWQDDNNQDLPYRFVLLHDKENYNQSLTAYRTELWQGLGTLAIFLLIAQGVILFWALAPLSRITSALKKMQQGDTSELNETYPKELQQVADSLNAVLERETALRKRYRNSLGDLAHSLKTPLAVLQSSIAESKDSHYKKLIDEQVTRMSQVVSYQLQRAVSENQTGTQHRCNISKVAEKLKRTLNKIYSDKNIQLTSNIDPTIMFLGDEQDLLEVLGNLLDNAYKYGNTAISIKAEVKSENAPNQLRILIEDNGAGINPSLYKEILKRGKRLDTSKPGQGIGLTVAVDIIESYQGSINVAKSSMGGACFIVTLPGVASNNTH